MQQLFLGLCPISLIQSYAVKENWPSLFRLNPWTNERSETTASSSSVHWFTTLTLAPVCHHHWITSSQYPYKLTSSSLHSKNDVDFSSGSSSSSDSMARSSKIPSTSITLSVKVSLYFYLFHLLILWVHYCSCHTSCSMKILTEFLEHLFRNLGVRTLAVWWKSSMSSLFFLAKADINDD